MTNIVVATRSGLAVGPDGTKYRLARGRTLADARHPLAQAHPDLFSAYTIELSVDDPEAGGDPAAERGDVATGAHKVGEVEAVAEDYRTQLATIAEGLYARGLVPAELDTDRPGWLAELIFAVIDAPATAAVDEPDDAPEAPAPDSLPKPRKRAPRPRAGDTQE
jgi:hypothetical protein